VAVAEAKVERVLERLDSDTPYFAEHCLQITTREGEFIPLVPRPGQLKVEAAMREQEEAGEPIRTIVCKARQTGVSTWGQGKMIQRTSRRQNRRARVVAHDDETATELFEIGQRMYVHLPEEFKPPLQYGQRGRMMMFGPRQRNSRATGPGFGSSLKVDTAADVTGGRGMTIHYLHLSEVAFWKDAWTKLLALLNAVPDVPDSMVLVESTANGFNDFKQLWDQAEKGGSAFKPVFIGWQEEPSYSMDFASPEERERFRESLGQGEFGEAEPHLVAEGVTLEQLHWRRWAIANKCGGSLDRFKQEFPSNAVEAFLATGSRVFEPRHVERILQACTSGEQRELRSEKDQTFVGKAGALTIPGDPVWKRRRSSPWTVWKEPRKDSDPPDRYVVAADVSGGEGAEEASWHAIQVIDHRTREQCARYRSRVDLDVLARQVFLAARYFNDAWLAIEVTGGWGLPVARICRRDFRYAFMYQRKKVDRMHFDSAQDRLGWDTNRITRPLLIEHGVALVRDGQDGIRDSETAREMLTFVRDEKGRVGPERGSHDDLLMAWLIAQHVAQELPLRRQRATSTATVTWRPRDPVSGY
jgi:hypothetical protein